MVHRLSRQQARRIAVRAQRLDRPRSAGLLELVHHLGLLQVDLTAAVAPSAELACWSRLGPLFCPADLGALVTGRSLVEFSGMLRPGEDIALFRAEMRQWPGPEPLRDWQVYVRDWVQANQACRQGVAATEDRKRTVSSRRRRGCRPRSWSPRRWPDTLSLRLARADWLPRCQS
jgi:uncharacterized protein YcaQ